MNFRYDQIVTTKDGNKHRVLWPVPGEKLRVKAVGVKHRAAYLIKIADIVA